MKAIFLQLSRFPSDRTSSGSSPWFCLTSPYYPCPVARPECQGRHHTPTKPCQAWSSERGEWGAGSIRGGQSSPDPEHPISPSYQAMDRHPGASTSGAVSSKPELVLSWAGAGVFFFWQLGAMKYLSERYNMSKVPMVGASGGALVAVLATCRVDTDRIIQCAYRLSKKYNLSNRHLGLLGALGPIVEEVREGARMLYIWGVQREPWWLDELLPENAHELCNGRVTIVVTELPAMKQVGISNFSSRQDLIDACMTSSHIPLVLDGKLARHFRNTPCIDGSAPDFFSGNCDLLTQNGGAIVFDYFDDSLLERRGRLDLIEMKTYEQVDKMYSLGYEYTHKLHEEGKFANFELEEVLLRDNGHMQEVITEITTAQ